MKQIVLCLVLWAIFPLLWGQQNSMDFMEGQLFVKLRASCPFAWQVFSAHEAIPELSESPDARAVFTQYQVRSLQKAFRLPSPRLQRIYRLEFDHVAATGDLLGALEALPYVEYAERIPVYRSHYTPNDLSVLQWHLPMIKAEQAWDYTQGNVEVLVGIVDDAVLLDHEDLASRIWTNPNEIPGDSIDNDGNGYMDDVNGYDAADDDPDANPPSAANNNLFSHGTHVAGISAAATDNGTGIASIGFNVRILPIKTKADTSLSNNFLQATFGGVEYAIAAGADVVNMSFGSSYYNGTMDYLIREGVDSGMVFVASAGNTGQFSATYPANYADVISVASTNLSDEKSGFSTYHVNVDVSAPGSGIYSCTAGSNSSYGFKSGTSMSSPLVAGLVALMRSVDSVMIPLDIRRCLKNSADNIDAQNPNYVGWLGTGRINAQAAMACMLPLANEPTPYGSGFSLHHAYTDAQRTTLDLAAALPSSGELRIEMRDLQGRVVARPYHNLAVAGEFTHQWYLPGHVAEGIYLLVWEFEGERLVQKVRL